MCWSNLSSTALFAALSACSLPGIPMCDGIQVISKCVPFCSICCTVCLISVMISYLFFVSFCSACSADSESVNMTVLNGGDGRSFMYWHAIFIAVSSAVKMDVLLFSVNCLEIFSCGKTNAQPT